MANKLRKRLSFEVKDSLSEPSAVTHRYVSGYHSSVGGETIHYHSPDPDADSALLVRGQDVSPSISWEIDPIPDESSDFSQFVRLAGIEYAGFAREMDSHNFDFFIDGQRWFTFRNAKDDTAKQWKVTVLIARLLIRSRMETHDWSTRAAAHD